MAAAIAASLTVASLGAAAPATAAPQQVSPEQLTAKVTTDGIYRHLRAFQRIADANGGNRADGTAGYQKSVDYVVNALTRAGFNVSTPEFTYTSKKTKTASFAVDGTSYPIGVMVGSGNSPLGGSQGKLQVAAANGCAAQDYSASVKGSVVLIQYGACSPTQQRDAAAAAGAIAAVIYNNTPGGFIAGVGPSKTIPVASLSQSEGQLLLGKAGRGANLNIQIEEKQVTSRNVIAQTRTGRVDNVAMAGAHLDGVPFGAGLNDNGSGSAALLETALQLGGSPKTKNAVRFAWWGAEEIGVLGSSDYVKNLTFEQQLDIAMYMNFDMIGSPNAGYFVSGGDPDPKAQEPLGSKRIANVFADYMQNVKGIVPEKGPLNGGTDYLPFVQAGIASAGLFTGMSGLMTENQAKKWGGKANQPYDPNYHQPGDSLDKINRTAIGVNSSAMAWAVATFATEAAAAKGIPTREQRAELQRKNLRSLGGSGG